MKIADPGISTGVPVWMLADCHNFFVLRILSENADVILILQLEIEDTLDTQRVLSCVQVSASSVKVLRRHSWGSWEDI